MIEEYSGAWDKDYQQWEYEFKENLRMVNGAIKDAEKLKLKIPNRIESKLHDAETQYDEARKCPYKKAPDAIKKMREAANSARAVLDDVFRLYFETACSECEFFEEHKSLVAQCSHYIGYRNNLHGIKDVLDSKTKLSSQQVADYIAQLCAILKYLKSVKPGLSATITEKEEEKKVDEKRFQASIKATNKNAKVGIAGVIVAILGIAGLKGCCESSQPPDQPEAVVSEADNSTPNP